MNEMINNTNGYNNTNNTNRYNYNNNNNINWGYKPNKPKIIQIDMIIIITMI